MSLTTYDDPVAFGQFDDLFLDELATFVGDRRVLEVFSGNGLLASRLAERGVSITATSLFSEYDGHGGGLHHPVTEMGASDAVRLLGPAHDILLMSWPTVTNDAVLALSHWGAGRDVVYIGEAADNELVHGGYPGCATDEFFASIDVQDDFSRYDARRPLERAMVVRFDPVGFRDAMARMAPRPALRFW